MRLEDVYDRLDEQRRLARILMPRFLRLLQAWHEMVASVFRALPGGVPPGRPRHPQAAGPRRRAGGADRPAAPGQHLREVLREGQKRGYSTYEIAHGVPRTATGASTGST